MRSRGAIELESWVASQGGLRAAGRVLGLGHGAVRRWVTGENAPTDREDLERRTGVKAAHWDEIASPSPGLGPAAPAVARAAPPAAPEKARRAPKAAPPAVAATARQDAPAAPPKPSPAPIAPETLEDLQRRSRTIPAELERLQRDIIEGTISMSAGEVIARMLERQSRAVNAAITSAGVATVEEVAALRALIVDVTSGCQVCKDRVRAALRSMAA